MQKFVTNSAILNQKIECNESGPSETEISRLKGIPENKTYTKELLGGRQGQQDSEQQKVLGVR